MLIVVIVLLVAMNITSFLLMGIDKRKAINYEWRIPERVLFLAAALFGGLGGTLGMFLFRHKTRHWYFAVGFPVLMVVQIVLLVNFLPKLL